MKIIVCKITEKAREAKESVELDLKYVTRDYCDNSRFFRKRKLLYLRPTVR